MNMISILSSWNLEKVGGEYYIANMHYSYLQYVSSIYDHVILISPVKVGEQVSVMNRVGEINNLEIVELPYAGSYVKTLRHYFTYKKIVKKVSQKTDLFYCRVPDPFSWMPQLLFHKKTIMHFVGDTIDATKHNEDWNALKKAFMILGYLPDYCLTLLAARKSKVYTNGHHLANKLSKKGIKATAVVSSTISKDDLMTPSAFVPHAPLRLIYVGYIRFAKGMRCLMQLWLKLKKKYPDFVFDLVGNGEMFEEVKQFVLTNDLEENVILHGHVDNREKLNQMLRSDDLFVFPSLSEGSPRVIVEAMSQGIPVLSTPVGSLPTSFNDGETIRFFDFDDADKALEIIEEFVNDYHPFIRQRDLAYQLVKEKYTKENFLSTVFSYEA